MGCKVDWIKEPVLRNCIETIDFYRMDEAVYPRFKSEVNRWIDHRWLVKTKCNEEGLISLIAVVQEKKDKVGPVLDFRELAKFVECSGADTDARDKKLRSWRQKLANCALLDLRNAYMQISAADECSKYQTVKFKGNFYKLSRFGFGLNCAPEIMKALVSKVLSLDEKISKATDHYYNDIQGRWKRGEEGAIAPLPFIILKTWGQMGQIVLFKISITDKFF